MSTIQHIGQRIKKERLAQNMTQRILAGKVGVGAPHISKIEAGREIPSDELIEKIAAALECDSGELLLVAGRMPPDLMETFAEDPVRSLEYLRQWKAKDN